MRKGNDIRIIISGGGTGGHIFPAVSIADELKRRYPESDILFVGAKGRMEMDRVPKAGYRIIGLPVSGLHRKLTLKNFKVLFDLFRSILKARRVIREFNPQIVIGVGGYASGPVLRSASRKGIPTLLQEQNSYAGITNNLLAKRARKICVAYTGMEKYFPEEKVIITGNPVRNIQISQKLRKEAYKHFELKSDLPVLLVVGGSLGARSLNDVFLREVSQILENNIQVIWQTGSYYFNEIEQSIEDHPHLKIMAFISRMDFAYNAANVMISRAGALSISEICLTGTTSVLVPSPNVSEDHQTKNAMALVQENAALIVKDKEAPSQLVPTVIKLLKDEKQCKNISNNSKKLGKPDATERIADEVEKLLGLK